MSDGPYRSLPMRKAWRDVAESAHKEAFTLEERADGMCAALHDDIKRDVGKDALNAMGAVLLDSQQGNLFSSQADVELEAIRSGFRPNGFLDAIVEHTRIALHHGMSGEAAFTEGLNRAALDQARACSRSVEEHYLRDTPTAKGFKKAYSVRKNLEATLQTARVRSFGAEVVQMIRGKHVFTGRQMHKDLDAGPVIA